MNIHQQQHDDTMRWRRAPQENFFENRRGYDLQTGKKIIKIFSGDWHVSIHPEEMLATILGSCVSACIRDPMVGVGGMNHFLLPGEAEMEVENGESARYGVFAMESLINGILKAGGRKERLEVKVFGGGNVINHSARIGSKNAAFIRHFLESEGLTIAAEDLDGDHPRRVHYFPDSGKVNMLRLRRKEDLKVVTEEENYRKSIVTKSIEGKIDLF